MVREIVESRGEIVSLCEALGIQRLFLFGSATQESTLAEARDLDFLVELKPLSPVDYARNYFQLLERLEALFQVSVDLVEAQAIDNPYFKEAVEERKVPLYAAP